MKIQIRKMNKRADIAVTLLVVMTVILCGAALFSFYSYNASVEKSIGDYQNMGTIYSLDSGFEFYLYNLAKASVNGNDANSFITNFMANYSYYNQTQNFYPEYMDQIKNLSKYDVKIINGELYFKLKDFQLSSDLSKISDSNIKSIVWKKDISFEIALK